VVFAKTNFTFLPSRAANRQIHSEYFNHCLTKQIEIVDILTDLTCSFLYSIETNLDNYQVILVKLYAGINNLLHRENVLSDISPQQFIDKLLVYYTLYKNPGF
jgi:hypothetical protein